MAAEPKPTDWAVLGVARGATRDEARSAYVARAMALHPDLHPDVAQDELDRLDAAMAALNVAWDRVDAWLDTPEATDGRPSRPTSTVRTVLQPPPGFRPIGAADRYALGDQLQLTGVSADLLGLSSPDREPVQLLRCTNRPLQDHHVLAIAELSELRSLDLDGTGITDGALGVLAWLPLLGDLHLSDTRITDGGLPAIARVPQLHSLSLAGTAVTDTGLAALAGHRRLSILNLRGTAIEGAGLRSLEACPALRILAVSRIDRHHRRSFADRRPDVTFA